MDTVGVAGLDDGNSCSCREERGLLTTTCELDGSADGGSRSRYERGIERTDEVSRSSGMAFEARFGARGCVSANGSPYSLFALSRAIRRLLVVAGRLGACLRPLLWSRSTISLAARFIAVHVTG